FLKKIRQFRPANEKSDDWPIRYKTEVTGVKIDGGKVTHIRAGTKEETVDRLLLAVPPAGPDKIVRNSPELAAAVPELDDLRKLEAMPVPALNLYFNKRIDLPKEHITLLDAKNEFYDPDRSLARKNGIASQYGLSLVDHSRLWPELEKVDKTVISVLAAD